MDNQNIVYMAYDGDNAGRLCGRAVLADNPDALHEISNRINLGHEVVKRWVESHGGKFISGGGDEGVFSIPFDAVQSVNELRADYEYATNLTATVGIGKTLSEAGKAMLVGKFRGKNMAVMYRPEIENEIQQAQTRMQQGTASAEEKKIGEAYLQPEGSDMNLSEQAPQAPHDCPYCKAQPGQQDPNHCKYCHDLEQAAPCPYCVAPAAAPLAESEDCQYCQNPKTGHDCPYCKDGAHDASVSGHPADCKYCAQQDQSQSVPDANGGTAQQVTPTAGPTVKNPTTTDSENYIGQDLNSPDLPKPEAIQHNPDGLGYSDDTPTNENVKLDAQGQGGDSNLVHEPTDAGDPKSDETVEGIAQEIENDNLPIYENSPSKVVAQMDDTDLATGTAMQGGVSRPENYADANAPKDLGLGEDEQPPDVTQLMQEGLDNHADNIGREKVINLVSEALVGFKACKGILEKAKLQAPQLYDSSLAMLKAMIEMAKMLGLDQEANTGDGSDPLGEPQGTASNPADGGIPAGGAKSGAGQGELATATLEGDPNSNTNMPNYAPKDSSSANGGPAAKQGAPPEKKSEGAIGQSVAKLPTHATTEHVARTPYLPNATNEKGQKKVIDPINGRIRWIDMKDGKVQSPTGVPVKPGAIEEEGPVQKEPDAPKVRH